MVDSIAYNDAFTLLPGLPPCPSKETIHPVDAIEADSRAFASYLALLARDALEDLHSEGGLTPDMRRLNTALRDSIYTALLTARAARAGDRFSLDVVRRTFESIPPYWELPNLLPSAVGRIQEPPHVPLLLVTPTTSQHQQIHPPTDHLLHALGHPEVILRVCRHPPTFPALFSAMQNDSSSPTPPSTPDGVWDFPRICWVHFARCDTAVPMWVHGWRGCFVAMSWGLKDYGWEILDPEQWDDLNSEHPWLEEFIQTSKVIYVASHHVDAMLPADVEKLLHLPGVFPIEPPTTREPWRPVDSDDLT
jgi:hypothetical protein